MSPQHDLGDLTRLTEWLDENVAGFRGPLEASKFSFGQSNPTYRLQAASGQYVLRRKPPGKLLPSAHAVEREYRVMAALAESDVPVPAMLALCEDASVVGTVFFVMEYLDGLTLGDPSLPDWTPADRTALYERQLQVLGALAMLDVDAIGLGDFGHRGHYIDRQLARWTKQYRASETAHIADMESLIEWLSANRPPESGRVALVHGDFRLDNMRVAKDRPEILGLIDWELSTLGDPLVDISYFATMLRMPRDRAEGGLVGLDIAALGIPSEREMLSRFCERAGLSLPDNWNFYLAFQCFRFVAIVQGVAKRHLDGNASSPKAARIGALARPIAAMGLALAGAAA